jgi:SAM-dependent methyltransferase
MATHAPTATAAAAEPLATELNPATIMQLASGFMAAKHLFAANELGLFEALADSPATLEALAARTGLTRRAARISADAMVALGLLEVEDGTYRNGKAAARFLSGPGPHDLRPFQRFWDKISYPTWTRLAEALASGPSREIFQLDDELQQVASAGIEAILAGPATALPEVFDFGPHQRLLDVGGGTGSWSIAIAQRHQHLTGAVLELPTAVELARTRVAAAELGHRITVITGDAMAGELPAGYDVFLLANLIHYWSAEQNQELLQRVRRAAQPGSALLLADFWTNPAHTEPLQAALMAGEFAAHIRTGDVYSVEEARAWLDHTGWRFTDHRPLAGPQNLVVAEAV